MFGRFAFSWVSIILKMLVCGGLDIGFIFGRFVIGWVSMISRMLICGGLGFGNRSR